MSFGLQGFTDAGKLLYTTEGRCLHFLGVASYSGAHTAYIARYTITSPAYPLVLAKMGIGDLLCVASVTNAGGNTWNIDVTGPTRGGAVLLCYGPLTTEGSLGTFGLRTLTATGQVSFDSTRNPLWLSEVFTQYGETLTISNMVVNYAKSYVNPACSVYAAAQVTPGPGSGIYYLGVKRTSTGHLFEWTTYAPRTTGTGQAGTTASRVNNAVFVIESAGLL